MHEYYGLMVQNNTRRRCCLNLETDLGRISHMKRLSPRFVSGVNAENLLQCHVSGGRSATIQGRMQSKLQRNF